MKASFFIILFKRDKSVILDHKQYFFLFFFLDFFSQEIVLLLSNHFKLKLLKEEALCLLSHVKTTNVSAKDKKAVKPMDKVFFLHLTINFGKQNQIITTNFIIIPYQFLSLDIELVKLKNNVPKAKRGLVTHL